MNNLLFAWAIEAESTRGARTWNEKEVASNSISLREQLKSDIGAMNVEGFAKKVQEEVDNVML